MITIWNVGKKGRQMRCTNNEVFGQISLSEMYPERRFSRKSCAATLKECSHKSGTCVEECCQHCDIPCLSRCKYSKGQPKVKCAGIWKENPDFKQ